MFLKDISLTFLGNIPTTIAIPLNYEEAVIAPNTLNLTFTQVYEQEKLFKELTEELSKLEAKETVSEKEICSILPMINNLTIGSDNRLVCDYKIRSLITKYKAPEVVEQNTPNVVITRKQILETINQASNVNEVNIALIELNEKEYINLGREGRMSVSKQFVQSKKIYLTEQDLVRDLVAIIKHMNQLLYDINGVKETSDFVLLLDELKLPMYLSLSTEVKKIIVDRFVQRNMTFNSVSSLANAIEKEYETMDIISATLNMDNRIDRTLIKS